jgi:splicing factor 3B subunit 3
MCSIALVKFACKPEEQYVIVGVSKDLVLAPRSLSGGLLQTYRVAEAGAKLELLHTTPVEDVPGAIAAFQGRVLIGVGRYLRVYDLGKKKLLRKCENKVL